MSPHLTKYSQPNLPGRADAVTNCGSAPPLEEGEVRRSEAHLSMVYCRSGTPGREQAAESLGRQGLVVLQLYFRYNPITST